MNPSFQQAVDSLASLCLLAASLFESVGQVTTNLLKYWIAYADIDGLRLFWAEMRHSTA